MSRIDWEAVKARHPLGATARRTGLGVPDTGRVMVHCPMPGHDDSTPSMQLNLDRNRYRCYGCGAHGDVVQWVQDLEAVTVVDAVAILDSGRPITAALTHLSSPAFRQPTERQSPNLQRTPAARVYAANAAAWHYYTQPTQRPAGADYLARRGIDVTALETELSHPVVGHTPNPTTGCDSLVTRLRADGFNDDELIDAGLATRRPNGSVFDLFWDRVILPVTDDADRVIGLLGRDTNQRPAIKYLNPPRTRTYDKSTALYRPTTPQLHADGNVVVCEGPLDALAIATHAATAGRTSCYAPIAACGRSLTDTHLDRILALHPRAPVFAADGDTAGRQANLEWATKALNRGRESVVVDWPDGQDPASWLAVHGEVGLRGVTRRGCLDAPRSEVRPRHCGAILTATALERLSLEPDRLDALDLVVADLSTQADRLGSKGRDRYACAAGAVVGPVVVDIVLETMCDRRERRVLMKCLELFGEKLPTGGRASFAAGAARTIEREQLGAVGWAEWQIFADIRAVNREGERYGGVEVEDDPVIICASNLRLD